MSSYTELETNLEDHDSAFTEVSFLLEVLTGTISDVIGQSMPSLAVNAGRQMGKKLPVYLPEPSLELVLETLQKRLYEGFRIDFSVNDKVAELEIGRCAIREVCHERKIELGGELCQMLHYYWSGMLAQLLGCPVRATGCKAGEICSLRMEAA